MFAGGACFRGHRRVRRRRRVHEEAAHVAEAHGVGDDASPLRARVVPRRARSSRRSRAQLERQQRAVRVHLPARERVARVRRQGRVVDARDARVLGEARREARPPTRTAGAGAARTCAGPRDDEERGERRDDPAEALHHEIARRGRRRSRAPQTQPPMASPWPPSALVIEWTTRSTPSACGVCAKGVANVLSAMVTRPARPRERDDGVDVGDGEVRVRRRLDVEEARARPDGALVGARRPWRRRTWSRCRSAGAARAAAARSRRTSIAARRRGLPGSHSARTAPLDRRHPARRRARVARSPRARRASPRAPRPSGFPSARRCTRRSSLEGARRLARRSRTRRRSRARAATRARRVAGSGASPAWTHAVASAAARASSWARRGGVVDHGGGQS